MSIAADQTPDGEIARPSKDRKHVTEFYVRYDPLINQKLISAHFIARSFSFNHFDHYPLYMEIADTSPASLLKLPGVVRLDGYNCGRVGVVIDGNQQRNTSFPAEFDIKGMLRATRNPLGNAYKILVSAGMKDGDGQVAVVGDEGCYYGWFHGLQPLMGKEGWDTGRYRVRPSGQTRKQEPIVWYLHSKCEIQLSRDTPPILQSYLIRQSDSMGWLI